jgi:hypothetical protein
MAQKEILLTDEMVVVVMMLLLLLLFIGMVSRNCLFLTGIFFLSFVSVMVVKT